MPPHTEKKWYLKYPPQYSKNGFFDFEKKIHMLSPYICIEYIVKGFFWYFFAIQISQNLYITNER